MSGQVSRGSAAEYQADERAGVAGLSWRAQSARVVILNFQFNAVHCFSS